MNARISITRIDDSRDGTFTAYVTIGFKDFPALELQLTVEAGVYGEVPAIVFRQLSDLGNQIATAAQNA